MSILGSPWHQLRNMHVTTKWLMFAAGAALVAYFSTTQTNRVMLLRKVYDFGSNFGSNGV